MKQSRGQLIQHRSHSYVGRFWQCHMFQQYNPYNYAVPHVLVKDLPWHTPAYESPHSTDVFAADY